MSNPSLLATWRQRWNRNLLRFLGRRVREAVDVEDLAQETYLRLLRSPDLREVRNPEAYLIRVASHVVAEWRQSQPPPGVSTPLDDDLFVDERTPDFEVERRILQQRLDEALKTLSPMMRAVLLLRLRDGRAYKDIAQALGITDRQVKRHLARGYDRLRRSLDF
jgi:RNA polymerase sigma factor (sigma-70 family)